MKKAKQDPKQFPDMHQGFDEGTHEAIDAWSLRKLSSSQHQSTINATIFSTAVMQNKYLTSKGGNAEATIREEDQAILAKLVNRDELPQHFRLRVIGPSGGAAKLIWSRNSFHQAINISGKAQQLLVWLAKTGKSARLRVVEMEVILPKSKPEHLKQVLPYTPQGKYKEGQRINHHRYGEGEVTKILDTRRIKIKFDYSGLNESEERIFIHNLKKKRKDES